MASDSLLSTDQLQSLIAESSEPSCPTVPLWEGEAQSYDFLAASLKKDDKIQSANRIHTAAAQSLEKFFTQLMREKVEVQFVKHEFVTGVQAIQDISLEQSLVVTWKDPKEGQEGYLSLGRSFFFQLYNRLLGGVRGYEKAGALSPVEADYLTRIYKSVLEVLTNAWKEVGSFSFVYQKMIADQETQQGIRWPFDCFRAFFNFKVADFAVLPWEILNVLGSLGDATVSATQANGQQEKDHHWIQAVIRAVSDTPVGLVAELGSAHASLQKVLQMQSGDEHLLSVPEQGHLLFVAGHPAFRVSLGTVGDQRAIKIVSQV